MIVCSGLSNLFLVGLLRSGSVMGLPYQSVVVCSRFRDVISVDRLFYYVNGLFRGREIPARDMALPPGAVCCNLAGQPSD
jgi:hypothetical protein